VIFWGTSVASLLATWLNVRKHRASFVIWIGTNAVWAWADATHGLPQQAALHVVYLGLAVYGIVHWRRPPTASSSTRT